MLHTACYNTMPCPSPVGIKIVSSAHMHTLIFVATLALLQLTPAGNRLSDQQCAELGREMVDSKVSLISATWGYVTFFNGSDSYRWWMGRHLFSGLFKGGGLY